MAEAGELATRIRVFIEKHARIAAAWDPLCDPVDERFNGPDSAMLESADVALEQGEVPPRVWSSWDSGCFKGEEGRAEHDEIVGLVNGLASVPRP